MANCRVCSVLEFFNLTLTFEELREGVRNLNGCKAGSLLLHGVSHFVSPDEISVLRFFVDYALYAEAFRRDKGERIFVEFSTTRGECSNFFFFFFFSWPGGESDCKSLSFRVLIPVMSTESPSIWPGIRPRRDVSLNSSSETCLQLAKPWLDKCRTSHMECGHSSKDPLLPTCVINVGSSSTDICLYLTKGETGKYVALSHCWGSQSTLALTTTKDTIEDLTSSIKFDEWSKTFAQVTEVARSLGIQYLWIYSLCIVQDSSEDWSKESQKMGPIYQNAMIILSSDGGRYVRRAIT